MGDTEQKNVRRYMLTVSFDGTDFCGWQVQANGISVQRLLLDSLDSVSVKTTDGVHGCSRTDSGVHADGFVCHFDSATAIPCDNIVKALNTKLPESVRAVRCTTVSSDFHARYSVTSKTYRYTINDSPISDPFTYKYEYHYGRKLDVSKMARAASFIEGKHDFSAFCASGSSVEDKTRTVYSCKVKRKDGRVTVEINGDGFLYNMVRIIVGTLISVSEGKCSPEDIKGIIDSHDRSKAGATAPACGLRLYRVYYKDGEGT